nr:SH3 domain-containing protein [Streptococcus gallolyticus]
MKKFFQKVILFCIVLSSVLLLASCSLFKNSSTTSSTNSSSTTISKSSSKNSTKQSSSQTESSSSQTESSSTEQSQEQSNAGQAIEENSSSESSSSNQVSQPESDNSNSVGSQSESVQQNTGMDINELANGDFSSISGTWQNDYGDTIVFNSNGVTSKKYSALTDMTINNNYINASLTYAAGGGIAIWFYPKGVATTALGQTYGQDSLVIAHSIDKELHPYYKVSNNTVDTSSADTSQTDSAVISDSETSVYVGTYTFSKRVPVKAEPKTSATTEFYFNSGDSINLAQKLVADGHTWITYTSYSGVKRYAMID